MRMMMQMLEAQQQGSTQMPQVKDQSLEINPAHPLIINLNHLRKTDS